MSKRWYENPEFLQLRAEWYKKLEDTGFSDIENIYWETGISGERLNGMSSMDMVRQWSPEKQRWYELARQFSWEPEAKWWKYRGRAHDVRAAIWRLLGEGYSRQEVGAELAVELRVSRIGEDHWLRRASYWVRKLELQTTPAFDAFREHTAQQMSEED